MTGILKTLYCIPCVWSTICIVAGFLITNYIRNIWVPFLGSLPSDGKVDGFADDNERMRFWDTNPMRIRTTWKWGLICAVIWAAGAGIALLVLTLQGQ